MNVSKKLQTKNNEFGLGDNIIAWLKSAIAKFPKVEKAVIFGSRATGHYKNYSDIDIAIFAPQMDRSEFSKVWNALDDLPIIYKMDILHFDSLSPDDKIREKILREGREFFR